MIRIEEIRDHFHSSIDYLASAGTGMTIGRADNCYWSFTGFASPFANRLAVYNEDPEVLERVLQPFYEANVPHSLKLGGAGLVHAGALISKGYSNEGTTPVMFYTLNPEQDQHTLRPGLFVKEIETREELQLCKEIINDGFRKSADIAEKYENPFRDDPFRDDPFLEDASSHRYLLLDEDVPICTTQFIQTGTFISCFATATITEHQKKGYGEELMRWAIAKHAAEGDGVIFLHASVPGQFLYSKIGFEVLEYLQDWQMKTLERMSRFTHEELIFGQFNLRQVQESDEESLLPLLNDELMAQWMAIPYPYTHEAFQDHLKKSRGWKTSGFGIDWVIERNGVPVGKIGCHHTDWKYKRTEIGYMAFANSRGTGVIPIVLRQLVEFLFTEYGFERIEVRTDVLNQSSRRAAEKAGFTLEGELRRNFLNKGEFADDAIFSIIQSDLTR